jgi:undecaprenyl-diphosphatase
MKVSVPARFLTPLFSGIAGALLALFLFERLADEILEGEKLQFDAVIRSTIHGFASPRVTEFMRVLSNIGDVTAVFILSLSASTALWLRRRRAGAILMATTVGGAVVLMWGLKLFFRRVRPEPYFGIPVPPDYSFPSGHALVAFCFYGVVAAMISSELKSRGARFAVWIAAAVMALGIGLSRIYLGVHYPSDVIGGYLAGAVWISGVAFVYRRFRNR